MSDTLSFKEEEFYNFILNKLIDLETELSLSNSKLTLSLQYLKPFDEAKYKLLETSLKEQRPFVRVKFAELYVAQLKGMSSNMDDFLALLLD